MLNTFKVLHSWIDSWSYPQTLDYAGKDGQRQTFKLIKNFRKTAVKNYSIGPKGLHYEILWVHNVRIP